MDQRDSALVRIDDTGAAHPVGRQASRVMRERSGPMRVLASPPHALILRAEDSSPAAHSFWMSGEITKPGVLWDLIGMAAQGNWTGELVVTNESSKRSVFFERGAVVAAYSSAERERLGEVLYHYGALTQEQVSMVAEAATKEQRFGEAAVALGLLSSDKLFELIGRQVEEIVYAAMLVSTGEFYFVESFDEHRLAYRLNLSVQNLLMEGVRRMDEMELFCARIPSQLHVPKRAEGASLPSDHEHHAVFQAVDGLRSVEEVARSLSVGTFEVTRALFQLMQRGAIVLHPPRPTGPEAIVTLFNQAIKLVLTKVDAADGGEDVREQLANFATASGVYDALFRGAGPLPDGTLDPGRIAESIMILVGREQAASMLAQWLYEYASFAMFIAEPLLRCRTDDPSAAPISEGAAVSRQVAELLRPLAPKD